ncbi:hypothetical protein ACFQY0_17440 [Haloferula chungangensis]|uniref:Uncharacterized protein n=1 Tax=Haloferula chungangensis TaxID=1048331 RepID=A0ABW2LCT1_9BACT
MKRLKILHHNYRVPQALPMAAAFGMLLPAAQAFEVPLASEWTLYDPEGNSSLSEQSPSGFTATISDLHFDETEQTSDANNRPVVLQEFEPLDLTEVGASIRARFDVTLLTEVLEINDSDFRFAFYDTSSNFEIIVGMADFGHPEGTGLRMRIDHHISSFDGENPDPDFKTGDYGNFAEGGGTLSSGGGPGSPGLRYADDISTFEAVITRISPTNLEVTLNWTVNSEFASTGVASTSFILDESVASDDVPPGGGFTQLNGFGFRLQDGDPFDQDGDDTTADSGSYKVSNLVIDRTLIVPLDDSWAEYDPDNAQVIADQTGSGFTATVFDVSEPAEGEPSTIPAIYQQFDPLDISQVGQSIEVAFDVTLNTQVFEANDSDFRFALYDTNSNMEMILGMIDFGPPSGTFMRLRIDNHINGLDENDEVQPFDQADFSHFTSGSDSLETVSGSAGDGLQYIDTPSRFVTKITRTSENRLDFLTTWTVKGSSHTSATATGFVEEPNPAKPGDVPASGKFLQMDGFGFKLFDLDPFDEDADDGTEDSGSYTVSNLTMRYCPGIVVTDGSIKVISVVRDSESGDITITWESEDGLNYDIYKSTDLEDFGDSPVETVTASGSTSSFTIPAAEVTSDTKAFFKIADQ